MENKEILLRYLEPCCYVRFCLFGRLGEIKKYPCENAIMESDFGFFQFDFCLN